MSVSKDTPQALKVYEALDTELRINGTQAIAICPFCGGQDKLYISKSTGQYECKKCGEKGNKYTFSTKLFNQMYDQRASNNDLKITQIRGIDKSVAKKAKLLHQSSPTKILIPIEKAGKKNLVNIRTWDQNSGNVYSLPGAHTLFIYEWFDEGPIFLCEAEFDAMALASLFKFSKDKGQFSICATPGTKSFKDLWAKKFSGREVYILFDNDHDCTNKQGKTYNSSKDGLAHTVKKLGKYPSAIYALDWSKMGKNLKDGYDIRDLYMDAKAKKKCTATHRKLMKAMVPQEQSGKKNQKTGITAIKRTSFQQVIDDFQSRLEFNQTFVDVLACCFACNISFHVQGQSQRNPIWMFIVAPPSTGKTTIIECFDGSNDTIQISELTPASLVTSFSLNQEDDEESTSILQRAKNRVLYVEDFTPILTSGANRDAIFGKLRAAYNGTFISHFARGSVEITDNYFSLVAGVTNAIEDPKYDLGDLGERFVRIRLIDDSFNEESHILKALENVDGEDVQGKENKEYFQACVAGYMDHMKNNPTKVNYNKEFDKKLVPLSMFVALCRTKVSKGKDGISVRPVPEVASRIAAQLKKLGLCLCHVYQREMIDDEIYRVMKKVAFDSCVGWKFEVLQYLQANDKVGMTVNALSEKMNISESMVSKILIDCHLIGLAKHVSGKAAGTMGKRRKLWYPSDKAKELMELADINFHNQPKLKTQSTKAKRNGKRKTKSGSSRRRSNTRTS